MSRAKNESNKPPNTVTFHNYNKPSNETKQPQCYSHETLIFQSAGYNTITVNRFI